LTGYAHAQDIPLTFLIRNSRWRKNENSIDKDRVFRNDGLNLVYRRLPFDLLHEIIIQNLLLQKGS
jgi:hypothetical protein